MTWLDNKTIRSDLKLDVDKLLKDRAALEAKIMEIKNSPKSKSAAGEKFKQEDMLALARKMYLIDQKLGRA